MRPCRLVDSIVNNNADGAYAPTSAAAWFDWVENSLLPVTMANTVGGTHCSTPSLPQHE